MRRALVDWYTANILLVIRGPEAAAPSDSNLFNKWTKVQVRLCVCLSLDEHWSTDYANQVSA